MYFSLTNDRPDLSLERARKKETGKQTSDINLLRENNIWSQVPEWARHQDVLTYCQSHSNSESDSDAARQPVDPVQRTSENQLTTRAFASRHVTATKTNRPDHCPVETALALHSLQYSDDRDSACTRY
jgi:hypothetical protein